MNRSPDNPQWIPLQEMVPQDSIGYALISQISSLGDRLRPETIFQQPLKPPLKIQAKFATNADVLRLSFSEFLESGLKFDLINHLKNYLEGILILPHSRLLAAVYDAPQLPVPPNREEEIVEGIEGALMQISSKKAALVLIFRFGLLDGITRTLAETGKQLSTTGSANREVIRQAEAKGKLCL
ncbi:MAG: hypothetical protein UU73_C0003G0058 [Candidatus Daviesbacteria bacterium GW2011_GWA1_41_61]|uniref:Uncharacterized protein n=1 Tax=Candidatus Daviesbacteria bacterium GW2011_GWA2_40_9 TaxID=1618424 RepID=A0A0G0WG27_9BACT|nr:MAG: hypothetical protein UU26_C0003G0170 [Candidatus Daviesbacteria bacterium GW2011_GWC1_40_9]KKR83245.1 MAG: hypothetical protein UU29_C0007G0115 [Candidatus Daviesbacteria bacterium GW2011_GWA2_40_9]KKR93590.1 MAG: hypothetical protein UU44_C0002G0251 [Candidatus Daviesbacteria bacterium GW2011_GWB1_41_15]KKS14859.1 MAG: hypothetical protein UU73_C0003G0058 [Candidatus Daviesbacteria bacterium GW2011_GWA1_41_61]